MYVVSFACVAFFICAKFLHDNEDTSMCNTWIYKMINKSDVCITWKSIKQSHCDILVRNIICGITVSSILSNIGKIVNTFSQNIEISKSAYIVPLAVTSLSLISHIMFHTGSNIFNNTAINTYSFYLKVT